MVLKNVELTRELVQDIKSAVGEKNNKLSLDLIDGLHSTDIASLYDEIGIEGLRFLSLIVDPELASDILAELDEDDQRKFLEELPGEVIAQRFIDNMDSDDAADILGALTEERKQEVLFHIDDVEQAGDIVDLLAYDDDSAGGLMAKEMIIVNENWTVLTCLKELAKQADEVDEVYYMYVVDDAEILKGIVSLKQMLLSKNNAIVRSIVEDDIISVGTETDGEEVARMMDKYDLVALPVVDSLGRLVGRITIDDVVDLIREEAEKDYQLASGITDDVEPGDRAFRITRARLPWLLIGLAGGILGSLVLTSFEGELRVFPEMAFFIPLIGAMGGNVGIQSSAIIVQGLANKSIRAYQILPKLGKELMVSLMNGFLLSTLIFVYNFFVSDSFALTITVSTALMTVVVFAALLGTIIPLLLSRFKIDPALATGPFITTLNDIIGLFIYMIVGRLLYTAFM